LFACRDLIEPVDNCGVGSEIALGRWGLESMKAELKFDRFLEILVPGAMFRQQQKFTSK